MTIKITQATLDDLQPTAQLFDAYRQWYHQKGDLDAAIQFLKERISNKESVILIAKDGENYAGFTQLYPIFSSVGMKRMWLLNDLYIDKTYRRKGIGKALVEAAQNLVRETNASALLLETDTSNTQAQQLYLNTGFIQSSTIFYYWSNR